MIMNVWHALTERYYINFQKDVLVSTQNFFRDSVCDKTIYSHVLCVNKLSKPCAVLLKYE